MWRRLCLRPLQRSGVSAAALVPLSTEAPRRLYATQGGQRNKPHHHQQQRSRQGTQGSHNRTHKARAEDTVSPDVTPAALPAASQVEWRSLIKSYSTLSVLLGLLGRGLHAQAGELYEQLAAGTPHPRHLVFDMCNGNALDAHDAVIHWIRAFTAVGRMDKVRDVFAHALRDLRATDTQACAGLIADASPLVYGAHVWRGDGGGATEASRTAAPPRSSIHLDDALLTGTTAAGSLSESSAAAVSGQPSSACVPYPSQLRHSIFNAYLGALTRRRRYDVAEVTFILQSMDNAGLSPDALTYHYLVELHARAGLNPEGLWHELFHERRLQPLPVTLQTLLLRVVPYSTNADFVLEVTREALRCGSAVMDKKLIAETIERWMSTGPAHPASTADTPSTTTTTSTGGAVAAPASSSPASSSSSSSSAGALVFPPDCTLWLLHELELRCVQDKASFVQYIQKQHLAVLLLACAKSADLETAEKVIAMMDRHAVPKTADVLALVVWCAAQAGAVEKAFDVIEVMARKGYLELTDPLRRYFIECVRYTMDKHFLAMLAEALGSVPVMERALTHLLARRERGLITSVHALDVVVLAAARLGEERRAMQLVSTYVSHWHVQPRTNTFNCLLVGNNTHRGTMLHRLIYDAMQKSGVTPNGQTFRVLIRQAVLSDNIDEAVQYLQDVTTHPGLRVEVEMVLPILERAARAGDVETVNRVSQFSLDCDVGIDGAVMGNVMKHLTDAGQDVAVLKGHLALHEALRSRSKAGRQRARHTVTL